MANRSTILVIVITGVVIAALGGIALRAFFMSPENTPNPDVRGDRLRVVATFFPLYDFARNVGRDRIDLEVLFVQTPEVVSFSPTDIQTINNADIVIKNGAGLEPVLDEILAGSDNRGVTVIDTSRGVGLTEEGSEETGSKNPHIWLDPLRATIQVSNIRDALIEHDPANADFYQKNADEYISKLQELDRVIAERTSAFSIKEFVAFHPAFIYFVGRYRLRQAAVIEEFPGKEPSPQYIAEVMKTIRDLGITAVFAEPQFSPRVVEAIANDLGIQVRVLDPIETGNAQEDSYISIMEKNVNTLEDVLK